MTEFPEIENFKEVETLLSSDLESKREQGIGKALQNVTLGIANTRSTISGLMRAVSQASHNLYLMRDVLDSSIQDLNRNVKEANESSEKLAYALNRITFLGTIIAGVGVMVAAVGLVFEIYKYFNAT
jgi:hypothetical protein